jgi:hypothetical protein
MPRKSGTCPAAATLTAHTPVLYTGAATASPVRESGAVQLRIEAGGEGPVSVTSAHPVALSAGRPAHGGELGSAQLPVGWPRRARRQPTTAGGACACRQRNGISLSPSILPPRANKSIGEGDAWFDEEISGCFGLRLQPATPNLRRATPAKATVWLGICTLQPQDSQCKISSQLWRSFWPPQVRRRRISHGDLWAVAVNRLRIPEARFAKTSPPAAPFRPELPIVRLGSGDDARGAHGRRCGSPRSAAATASVGESTATESAGRDPRAPARGEGERRRWWRRPYPNRSVAAAGLPPCQVGRRAGGATRWPRRRIGTLYF